MISREEIDTLGRYNAERARGILHTPEWMDSMAELQARFDEEMKARFVAAQGGPVMVLPAGFITTSRPVSWWQRLRRRLTKDPS